MKATLKSLVPSILFLAAAAAFATVGWTNSSSNGCDLKHQTLQADGCCAKPDAARPVHAASGCCNTNSSADARP